MSCFGGFGWVYVYISLLYAIYICCVCKRSAHTVVARISKERMRAYVMHVFRIFCVHIRICIKQISTIISYVCIYFCYISSRIEQGRRKEKFVSIAQTLPNKLATRIYVSRLYQPVETKNGKQFIISWENVKCFTCCVALLSLPLAFFSLWLSSWNGRWKWLS